RVTLVLGDADIDNYLGDLVLRQTTYQELMDAKVMQLRTSRDYERFVDKLGSTGLAEVVKSRERLPVDAYRKKSVELMSLLNPERVFQIRFPVDGVLKAWHDKVAALAANDLSAKDKQLDTINALLPGRINLYEMSPELAASLSRAADLARSEKGDSPALRDQALALLGGAGGGHYRGRDGAIEAVEFTAIYPAGTIDATTTYQGETLPVFGVTGVWPLIRRDQGRGLTGMVDYVSPNPGYGFITMLPYQHAGGIEYNAFPNAGVRCALGDTPFLPNASRKVMGERDPKKPYQNLWIIARGPTSHGCTRLASGHMNELRQIVPSESPALERVASFRSLPQCYDVFDIRGDGTPQVMGVQYYLAYKNRDHTPIRSYVTNRREP